MIVNVSPMTIEHYEGVYALWTRTEGLCLGSADSRDKIEQYLDRNPGFSHIATIDGAIVGAILCGHDGRRAFIHHLAVERSHRGKGIANSLVDSCMRRLESAGIELSHVFVLNANKNAVSFWEHNGWEIRDDLAAFGKSTRPITR